MMTTTDEMVDKTFAATVELGLVPRGHIVVMIAGAPVGVPGTTNLIKAEVLK